MVSIDYVKRIDYTSCKQQFDQFCRHIFEKIFVNMNTGPDEILQFDPDASTFKLLLCLLTGKAVILLILIVSLNICRR